MALIVLLVGILVLAQIDKSLGISAASNLAVMIHELSIGILGLLVGITLKK